jgi:hypothetical protein
LRTSEKQHQELISLARDGGLDAVYVANYAHQHIGCALEFYNFARNIIVAKPLDTCLEYLLNITKDQDNFCHLLRKLYVHDHYLHKPGVTFLRDRMAELHSEHDFLDSIELFLVERATIEKSERARVKALSCGMIFDLAVHLISILQAIVPINLAWQSQAEGSYERRSRRIEVTACTTAKSAGSMLGESTVIRGREAETFGVIELLVTEQVSHENGDVLDKHFPVLVVVGKGLPGEPGMTRDLKTIVLNFRDGAEVALDLDTYQFRGVDSAFLKAAGYENIDRRQRGINLPLVAAAHNNFDLARDNNPFQSYAPALEGVRILWQALTAALPKPEGYRAGPTSCRQLLSDLLRKDRRFSPWDLPQNFGNFHIGEPPQDSIP